MESSRDERKNSLLKIYIYSNKDRDFSIFANKKSAYFIMDLRGEMAYANHLDSIKVNYSSIDPLAMKIKDLFPATELDKNQTFFYGRDPETLSTFNSQIINGRGEALEVRLTFFPLYDSGEHLGTFILLRDPAGLN